MTKADFIRQQLRTLPVVDWSNSKQAKILCPFHDDSNPSLDVSLVRIDKGDGRGVAVGGFNCWSCKEHGPWNKLAEKLNLAKWTEDTERDAENTPDNPFFQFSQDIKNRAENSVYEKFQTDGPWQGTWRGLSGSFLRSIGAESWWDAEAGEYRIYLPVHDAFGKHVGHVLARGDNSQIPNKKKYLNSKGFNGRGYWYGLNFEDKPKTVVIVEGPFDMLRFRSLGIPAIANLGVQLRNEGALDQTVSEAKIMQLIAKGVQNVVLALDADEAGRMAVQGFLASFSKWHIKVYDLDMSRYLTSPDQEMDPGNCPLEVVNDLKAFLETLK